MNEDILLTPVEAAALTRSGARISAAARELEAAQAESSALIAKVLQRYGIDPAGVDPESVWDMDARGDEMVLTVREPGSHPVLAEEPQMEAEAEPPGRELDGPPAE